MNARRRGPRRGESWLSGEEHGHVVLDARSPDEQVLAVADGAPAPEHLTSRLGPVPGPPSARDTWLGLALHIERRLDARLDIGTPDAQHAGHSIADQLDQLRRTAPLEHAQAIIAAAEHDAWPVDPDAPIGPQPRASAIRRTMSSPPVRQRGAPMAAPRNALPVGTLDVSQTP